MKAKTIELITSKLSKDLSDIRFEIYTNKKLIRDLATKQRVLKDARHELHKLINGLYMTGRK